jgi:hypothetical protein
MDACDFVLSIGLPEGAQWKLEAPHDMPGWLPLAADASQETTLPIWILRMGVGAVIEMPLMIRLSSPPFSIGDEVEIRTEIAQAPPSSFSFSGDLASIDSSPTFATIVDAVLDTLAAGATKGWLAHKTGPMPTREEVELRTRDYLLRSGADYGRLIVRPPIFGAAIGGVIGAVAAPFLGVDPWTGAGIGAGFGSLVESGINLFQTKVRELAGAANLIASAAGRIAGSLDPNDKAGPVGYDSPGTADDQRKRYIQGKQAMGYVIFFENLDTATAPAQEVLIIDQLDANLDWSTFVWGQMQIGDVLFADAQGSSDFAAVVDLRPNVEAQVDVICGYYPATGRAECLLRGRDPTTGRLVDFLPPNTATADPNGQGWVSFNVMPKPDLPAGTVIKNKATIDFEVGIPPDPMDTPEWVNTISDLEGSGGMGCAAGVGSAQLAVFWVMCGIGLVATKAIGGLLQTASRRPSGTRLEQDEQTLRFHDGPWCR